MTALKLIGKFLISVGVGVLLFVVWTLWGTGFYTGQQQDRLEQAFAEEPEVVPEKPNRVGPPKGFSPSPGDPVFRIRIPAIEVDKIVVEGVGVEELKKGPGHYPACSKEFKPPFCLQDEEREFWPGQDGRVIVSGHRTTYGAPFWALNELKRGDEIITETKWGDFVYRVTDEVVVDDDEAVAVAGGSGELLLTTCNPRFSAEERYLVYAELVGER